MGSFGLLGTGYPVDRAGYNGVQDEKALIYCISYNGLRGHSHI